MYLRNSQMEEMHRQRYRERPQNFCALPELTISPQTSTVSATLKLSELSPFSLFFHVQFICNYDVFIQHLSMHTPLMKFNQNHVFTIFIKILTSAKCQQYHIC